MNILVAPHLYVYYWVVVAVVAQSKERLQIEQHRHPATIDRRLTGGGCTAAPTRDTLSVFAAAAARTGRAHHSDREPGPARDKIDCDARPVDGQAASIINNKINGNRKLKQENLNGSKTRSRFCWLPKVESSNAALHCTRCFVFFCVVCTCFRWIVSCACLGTVPMGYCCLIRSTMHSILT